MSNRVLCKFFAHGACLKGEHCEYAHDWSASANNICTFYQRGACAYGSRCRYDHVKVPRIQPSESSSSTISRPSLSMGVEISATAQVTNGQANLSQSKRQFVLPTVESRSQEYQNPDTQEDNEVVEGIRSDNLAEQVICSFAAAGDCPRGDKCPHIHGDLCPTCGKHCLHPFRPKEREEHSRTCEKMQKHVEALKHSQEIECSVCLERVLSKPAARERKFGLLSECDHPFCITCIRNWRSSSPTSGMDVNSTLRACPICRKLSYYVIPSVIWYFSKEEKDQIVENYKAKLKSIDCKYFDFGNGSCPFGSSCFYKHKVKRGSQLWKRAMNPNMFADPPSWSPFDNNEHFSLPYMNTIRDLFGDMFQPVNGMLGMVDMFNSIDLMEFQMKMEELQRKYPGGFSEEDFPTPEDIWSLLEHDWSDGDDDDDEDDYFSAGFGEDFLTPWDMLSLLKDMGEDEDDDEDENDNDDDDEDENDDDDDNEDDDYDDDNDGEDVGSDDGC